MCKWSPSATVRVCPRISQVYFHVSWEPDHSYHVKTAPVLSLSCRYKECVCLMLQSLFVGRWLFTGGTVVPVSLITVVPTVLGEPVFYGYLTAASVSVGLRTQFVHFCLVTARAFMPASLIVVPYAILEISKFLGQLLVYH